MCLRNLAVVTGEPLAFCQITNPVIGFGPPTSAAIQDISGLHPSTSCVERAPNRDVVTLFVTTCEDHLGIRNDNLQFRAVQTTRTEAGAANLELPIRWPRPSVQRNPLQFAYGIVRLATAGCVIPTPSKSSENMDRRPVKMKRFASLFIGSDSFPMTDHPGEQHVKTPIFSSAW